MQDLLASISVIVASVGLIVGIFYYFLILRGARKREKIDMAMRLYMSYNNKEFHEADALVLEADFKDYDDFKSKYGLPTGQKAIHLAIRQISSAFEMLGFLLYNKLIDLSMVQTVFQVDRHWEKLRPIVEAARIGFNDPTYLMYFEYLYNEWKASQEKP